MGRVIKKRPGQDVRLKELAEAGFVLVRADDDATLAARTIYEILYAHMNCDCPRVVGSLAAAMYAAGYERGKKAGKLEVVFGSVAREEE